MYKNTYYIMYICAEVVRVTGALLVRERCVNIKRLTRALQCVLMQR